MTYWTSTSVLVSWATCDAQTPDPSQMSKMMDAAAITTDSTTSVDTSNDDIGDNDSADPLAAEQSGSRKLLAKVKPPKSTVAYGTTPGR